MNRFSYLSIFIAILAMFFMTAVSQAACCDNPKPDCPHHKKVQNKVDAQHDHNSEEVTPEASATGDDTDPVSDEQSEEPVLAPVANLTRVDEEGKVYAFCPVHQEEIDVHADRPYAMHNTQRYYINCNGCKASFEKDPASYSEKITAAPVLLANGTGIDEDGKIHAYCPVMKRNFVIHGDSKFSDHDSKRYYFCCDPCKEQFDESPESYLKAEVSEAGSEAVEEEMLDQDTKSETTE